MANTEQPVSKLPWDRRPVGQRFLTTFFLLFGSCVCACCLLPVLASGCGPDDVFFRVLLGQTPQVVFPEHTTTLSQGSSLAIRGGTASSFAVSVASPEEVVAEYRQLGGTCVSSPDTVYMLGGFELDLQSEYWDCSVPARPWGRGSVVVLPQAAYASALRGIYNDPPELVGDITIDQTIVGSELRNYDRWFPETSEEQQEQGSVLKTWVAWCEPF